LDITELDKLIGMALPNGTPKKIKQNQAEMALCDGISYIQADWRFRMFHVKHLSMPRKTVLEIPCRTKDG
jgi:hypothetical protein